MAAFKFPGMGIGILQDESQRRSIEAHMKSSSSPSSEASSSSSSSPGAVLGFLLLALGTASLGAAFLLLGGLDVALLSWHCKL